MRISKRSQNIKAQNMSINRFEKGGFQVKDDVVLGSAGVDDDFLVNMKDLASLKSEEESRDISTGKTYGSFMRGYAGVGAGVGAGLGILIGAGVAGFEGVLYFGGFFGAFGAGVGLIGGQMNYNPDTPAIWG